MNIDLFRFVVKAEGILQNIDFYSIKRGMPYVCDMPKTKIAIL